MPRVGNVASRSASGVFDRHACRRLAHALLDCSLSARGQEGVPSRIDGGNSTPLGAIAVEKGVGQVPARRLAAELDGDDVIGLVREDRLAVRHAAVLELLQNGK